MLVSALQSPHSLQGRTRWAWGIKLTFLSIKLTFRSIKLAFLSTALEAANRAISYQSRQFPVDSSTQKPVLEMYWKTVLRNVSLAK
jgi:hypothetical protein